MITSVLAMGGAGLGVPGDLLRWLLIAAAVA
jgi:hypothetical protein